MIASTFFIVCSADHARDWFMTVYCAALFPNWLRGRARALDLAKDSNATDHATPEHGMRTFSWVSLWN